MPDKAKAQEDSKKDLLKKSTDTPSVQGAAPTAAGSTGNGANEPEGDAKVSVDKKKELNDFEKEQENQQKLANTPRQVGSPIAPKPNKGKYSNTAEDADRGEDKPMPHLDNTDAEDKMAEVHEHGKTPEGMRAGAEASVPKTDQKLSDEDADNLDLEGIKKALTTARNKVRTATENGVKLTREEFDDHLEVVQIAQEVTNLLGNLR